MSVFLNPVILSVALMVTLCLFRFNVFLSIILASLACGLLGGATLSDALAVFTAGMSGNNAIVLAMLLFGIVAEAMNQSGVGNVLAPRLSRLAGSRRWILLLILFILAILSESVFMLGPAFAPIVVPPLIAYTNEIKLDRRCIAAVMVGGLQIGYACIPFGFGLAFHQMIGDALLENGITAEVTSVWKNTWPFGLAMLLGTGSAILLYRKSREYAEAREASAQISMDEFPRIEQKHWAAIVTAIVTITGQFLTSSLALGALIGIALLLPFRIVSWRDFETICTKGIRDFGAIAFALMGAAGFAAVFRKYGQIDVLVSVTIDFIGGSKLLGSLAMLLLGLILTIGIGSGFAAVPIVSTIVVPMCVQMSFNTSAAILIVAASSALGDCMTPASSQTLLPTAALNLDGQHDHIRDTCLPVSLCYCIPVILAIVTAASVW